MAFVCIQDLYGYVYSTGLVEDCFTLSVHPKHDSLFQEMLSSGMGVVTVEKRNDSPDVFALFSTEVGQEDDAEVRYIINKHKDQLTFYAH